MGGCKKCEHARNWCRPSSKTLINSRKHSNTFISRSYKVNLVHILEMISGSHPASWKTSKFLHNFLGLLFSDAFLPNDLGRLGIKGGPGRGKKEGRCNQGKMKACFSHTTRLSNSEHTTEKFFLFFFSVSWTRFL